MMYKKRRKQYVIPVLLCIALLLAGCGQGTKTVATAVGGTLQSESVQSAADLASVPEFSGDPYVILNQNEPEFPEEKWTTEAFEFYSDLDALGRCGTAYANICEELMPTEERGQIGMVKPSGWHTVKYNDLIDGNYLYNRCHLVGYQLAGENANEKNLITGTRYLNVEGMLPFENMVADYVHETGNHVLYRVTPVFEGENLVASGVQMEALSVEDKGEGIRFNVYCYNSQPGISIDYATGDSRRSGETTGSNEAGEATYIINKGTRKFHRPDCSSVKNMKAQNKREYTGSREELISEGYDPCDRCQP